MARVSGFEQFKVSSLIEPVEHGKVRIERIEVTREDVAWATVRREGRMQPGPLTQLFIGNTMMMSDGFYEFLQHFEAIKNAKGRVLVNGLGLGCYLKAILSKPEVEHVQVIELLPDVIEVVGPYYTTGARLVCEGCGNVEILHRQATGDQFFCCHRKMRKQPLADMVEILHADAFDQSKKWPVGSRWDCVWHDLWPSISEAYLPQMAALKRSYGRRCGWQACWSQDEILREQRRDRAWA